MIWQSEMEGKKTGRKRIIGLRLTGDEYGVLEKNWKKSTIRKLSEYVRRVLFGKAVTVYTRNQSLDELVAELVLLRKELNAIGVNFNQAVHRLHTLDHLPQMQRWLMGFESDRDVFFGKAEEIKQKVNSISEQWLQ
ncbi:plasmid mobilization protein [Mucilaginibacter sp. McL0603]|uniref:plasmid mobilization protein n=1 Tax=Mucilaginibacter sp. McL0603 TaxID=3415670 RepID=UPI003CF861D7